MENVYAKSLDSLLHFWERFSLPGKLKSLQESMDTITKAQEASVKSRKELAAKTKEIRNVPANERLAFMKGLLKLYQDEIDHLTLRSQYICLKCIDVDLQKTCFHPILQILLHLWIQQQS